MKHGYMEVEIENFIWETLGRRGGFEDLTRRGIHFKGTVYRQLEIPGFGIADLVSVSVSRHVKSRNTYISINVYELKKGKCRAEDLAQIMRYMAFFQYNQVAIFKHFGISPKSFTHIDVYGYLVGDGFESDVARGGTLLFSSLSMLEYDFDLVSGLKFSLVDPYVNICLDEIPKTSFPGITAKKVMRQSFPMVYNLISDTPIEASGSDESVKDESEIPSSNS